MTDFSFRASFLQANVDRLSPRDRSFALSLLDQWTAHGSLSQKQSFWVEELARRAQAAAPAAPAVRPETRFTAIVELFAKAGNRAAIVFQTQDGERFRLSVAGPASQAPGSINVTDTNKGFSDRTWFGRINLDGHWQPSRRVDAALVERVQAALEQFAADPDEASALFGRETGICCFCGRELTDERSVSVGRGPICSERFGLPWGSVPGNTEKLTATEISDAEIPF